MSVGVRTPRTLLAVALLIAALGGVTFAFVTPPFQVPDEPAHFFRAFALAEGHVVAERRLQLVGADIPDSISLLVREHCDPIAFRPEARTSRAAIAAALEVPLAPHLRTFSDFRNTAVHAAPAYLPQAAGIWIARQFTDRALPLLYAARLANLVVSLAMLALALRSMPVARLPAVLLAVSPMTLSLLGSASGDAYHMTAGWLATALLLRCAAPGSADCATALHAPCPESAPSSDGRGACGGSGTPPAGGALAALALLGASKPVCLFLALLVLAIPRGPVGPFRTRRAFTLAAAAALAAGFTLTLAAAHDLPLRPDLPVGPSDRVTALLSEPVATARAIASHFVQYAGNHVATGLGFRLGWLDTELPTVWFASAFCVLVATLAVRSEDEARLTLRAHAAALLAFAGSAVAVVFALYAIWTPPGSTEIDGVQGRYFLPASWALAAALAPCSRFRAGRVGTLVVAAWLVVSLTTALVTVRLRFYG